MCCRTLMTALLGLVLLSAAVNPAFAARSFRLAAPADLVESGFLKYLLPRFSLKTSIRIEIVGPEAPADAVLNADGDGTAVFEGLGRTWSLKPTGTDNPHLAPFTDWITGDIGRRTIGGFQAADGTGFAPAVVREAQTAAVVLPGDAVEGEVLAVRHCGRCHVVNKATRMASIGSSPSFAVMRSFADWQARFEAFFALKPHPAFTIIEDVTEPFDETRPSPIVPVEMTLSDLEAILAFVSRIPPADLGAPIQYQ